MYSALIYNNCIWTNIQQYRGDGATVHLLQQAMTESLDKKVVFIEHGRSSVYTRGMLYRMLDGGHIYNKRNFHIVSDTEFLSVDNYFRRKCIGVSSDKLKIFIDHHAMDVYRRNEHNQRRRQSRVLIITTPSGENVWPFNVKDFSQPLSKKFDVVFGIDPSDDGPKIHHKPDNEIDEIDELILQAKFLG